MIIRALADGPREDLPEQGLQGLQGFLAAQGLHGFFAAHGLHGFIFLAAHGLQGLHGFIFLAAHGLHGFRDAASLCVTNPTENTNASANTTAKTQLT